MVESGGTNVRQNVVVGLLGRDVGPSRTPRMHMQEGRAQGLDYDYRLIDTAGADTDTALGPLLVRLQDEGFNGLNVTYPYKQQILPLLDELSEAARAVGAVNTVVFRDGRRCGHNTDCWGFGESFRRGLPDAGRDTVLLIGAGGAGAAVANALLEQGTGLLLICDTNDAAAHRLAERLAGRYGEERAKAVSDPAEVAAAADGLVNATPMGMAKLPGLPIADKLIETRHWIADIVYFPLETAFLATARAKGCAVLSGAGMAVFQAVRAFELFTGLKADPERMWRAFSSFETEVEG
ncbi:shikimate dehydrogenase [Mesorhizobium xinjiangense]|uniref:shikimate dehydrogenase n=1 Tax=Mesorhizobium xinjiangense TaxID=2678685 RepID=UPI0012ED47B4|nr:shikimate dehydrogenase [Mesorhizobium xinjiangense]